MTAFDESKHNRATDGKFANKPHAEADGVNLTPPTPLAAAVVGRFYQGKATAADEEAVFAAFEAALPETVTLTYVPRGEGMSEEQLTHYLAGDGEKFDEAIDEMFDEQREYNIDNQLDETLKELGLTRGVLPETLTDELRSTIHDRDESDPTDDLLYNTSDPLMRYDLAKGDTWTGDSDLHRLARQSVDLNEGVDEARTTLLEQQLLNNGVINQPLNDEDKKALNFAFCEGPEYLHEGVTVGAVFTADPQAVNLPLSAQDESSDPNQVLRTVTPTGHARIVILDETTGSGADTQLTTPITMNLTARNHAKLDSPKDTTSWGWDRSANVDYSAYKTTFNDVE